MRMQNYTTHSDDDHLEIKSGGGCIMLFGLPFFLAGLGVMSAPFWSGDNDAPAVVLIPFGLIFASVGAGFIFGRAGLTADKRTRTVTKWWGLLVPFSKKEYPFDEFKKVTITKEIRRSHSSKGHSSTYTVYPVRLVGGESLTLCEPRSFGPARKRSEQFAKFLELSVEDTSSGALVVREAGTLDESLRDRLRREGRAAERPDEPDDCRVKTSAAGGEAAFEIPPRGFGCGEVGACIAIGIWLIVSIGFGVGIFGAAMSGDENTPPFVIAFMSVFALLWFGIPLGVLLGIVSSTRAVDTVTVSPRELKVARKGLFGTRTRVIPADELEELFIGGAADTRGLKTLGHGGSVLIARSDEEEIKIGAGLRSDEIQWLHDVIQFIVTA